MGSGATNVRSAPLRGTASTSNTGWSVDTEGGLNFSKTVPITGVTSSMRPQISFENASYQIAVNAGISYCRTYTGGINLHAYTVPTGTVSFNYVIEKNVASSIGGTNVAPQPTIRGSASTDNTGWTTTTTAGFAQFKDVPITGVTAAMFPSIAFTTATYTIALDANMTLCSTYAGGIRLFADSVPTGTVTFDYVVTRG